MELGDSSVDGVGGVDCRLREIVEEGIHRVQGRGRRRNRHRRESLLHHEQLLKVYTSAIRVGFYCFCHHQDGLVVEESGSQKSRKNLEFDRAAGPLS